MSNPKSLRDMVEAELAWEPSLDAQEIGVAAHDGAVTLTGHVLTYAQKIVAEKAAKRVTGVLAVANDLLVRPAGSALHDDTNIAEQVADVLAWHVSVPESVKAVVKDGWVTLSGTVDSGYQKRAAENAVRGLRGVRGINNDIVLKPRASPAGVKDRIEDAFRRSAQIDAAHVHVSVVDGMATLNGSVRSWSERKEAEYAAEAAPGVTSVRNDLKVSALAYA